MLLGIDGVYVDPTEICAVYPPDPGVVNCSTVLLKNGHAFDVDVGTDALAKHVVHGCNIAEAVARGALIHPGELVLKINEVDSKK